MHWGLEVGIEGEVVRTLAVERALRRRGELCSADDAAHLRLVGMGQAIAPPVARGPVRRRLRHAAGLVRRVLILGGGDTALRARSYLEESDCAVEVVGFYTNTSARERPSVPEGDPPVIAGAMPLLDAARAVQADEIVVAVADRRGGVLPLRELLDCRLNGIKVFDLSSHFEHHLGQIPIDSLNASWLIFGDGFRQDFLRRLVKRTFDIVCSLALIVLGLPLMALAALAIVWESGFPVLYRQERVGRNNRTFHVIKFRSMRVDAEKDGRPRWASANDSRVTRVGAIIRKLRIDELPQLFSVLKGDMSLVGPRPERPFFVEQLTAEIPFYAVRHSLKPGLTGWAQVRYAYGACKEDAVRKLQYDLYYVKNHSLVLDLKILFSTVGVVLTGKGAQ
jgi:sugar transferase (PEP-CTERM system associated)